MSESNATATNPRFKNLMGKRFGRFTVIAFAGRKEICDRVRDSWLCRCNCGNQKTVLAINLHDRDSISCGCYRQDAYKQQRRMRTCPVCLKSFVVPLNQAGRRKCCSKKCFYLSKQRTDPVERFRSYISALPDERGCLNWCGTLDKAGYGAFTIQAGVLVKAHRFAFSLATGQDPGDKHVCHKCDNPRCVNPVHLFLGTNDDNRMDSVKKNRHVHGERCPNAKLTDADVREILKSKITNMTQLGREYGVGRHTIKDILRGIGWKHVPRPSIP